MFKQIVLCLMVALLFVGCGDKEKGESVLSEGVDASDQRVIKELILKGKNPPKAYKELSWKKLGCSEVIAKRLQKKAAFVVHRFEEKHVYGGTITRDVVYFIGNDTPRLIIDFDVKIAFAEFLANPAMQTIFAPSIWDLKALHVKFQNRSQEVSSQASIKDFIYSISHFSKDDQNYIDQEITKANTPMSIAKNVAIFMSMRLFPELIEELIFGEVTYTGTYK